MLYAHFWNAEPPNMWKSVQHCEQRTLEQRYKDVTIMIIMIRQAE